MHLAPLNIPIYNPIDCKMTYSPIETLIYYIHEGTKKCGFHSEVVCAEGSDIEGAYCTSKTLGGWHDNCNFSDFYASHFEKTFNRINDGFDILHSHLLELLMYEGINEIKIPVLTTLHIDTTCPIVDEYVGKYLDKKRENFYFNAISHYQKDKFSKLGLDIFDVIHCGIDVEEFPFNAEKAGYLFTIGRITEEKGQDIAIEVAKKSGKKLIMTGIVQNKKKDEEYYKKVLENVDLIMDISGEDGKDNGYFERVIKPLINSEKQILYIKGTNDSQKKQWYKYADATLFPISWDEPFGLVMIESMACGTPVIAYNRGAIPEVIKDGKTGFIVEQKDGVDGIVDRINQLSNINPQECRKHVKENFDVGIMVKKYAELYEKMSIVNKR